MKKKVTREEVLESIIELLNEYGKEGVEEKTQLGDARISINCVMWMYDWLAEKYSKVNMTIPSQSEVAHLVMGDTIGKLADIAMKHISGDGTYEVSGKVETKDTAKVTKQVAIFKETWDEMGDGGMQSVSPIEELTKEEFLARCAEFYDARGSHIDDYEVMTIRMP
jgi:hypothetical protein